MTADALASHDILADNAIPLDGLRLNQRFEAQVRAAPHAIALLHDGQSLTYRELDRRANQLAHHLRSLGAGPECTVAVCLPRSFDMIVALFAILKAGAAYVPLDLRAPPQRLEYMLQDSAAVMLITPTPLIKDVAYSGIVLDLNAQSEIIALASEEQPALLGDAESLAYVMYTSGSTGLPKGVMLNHTATNVVTWASRTFTREDIARVAATTSLGFGPSVLEIFVPLCLGGSVIIKDNLLAQFSGDEQPTMLFGSPSVLSQLLDAGAIPDSVRVINVGGEIVRAALAQRIYAASQVQRIYLHYGPTEATNCTVVSIIPRGVLDDPPVGRPIYGIEIYVLNSDGQPVGDGEVGEIHIGGKNLARGYRNKDELTAASFIPDPFGPAGSRMYRSGDLGRWSKTGDLECLGRIDDQVKLSGVRIELKEIEAVLLRIDGVRQAAATVANDSAGAPRLVAYIQTDEPMVPAEIRQALSAWLPPVMIPSSYIFLQRFPLNLSGKIDRVRLFEIEPPPPSPVSNPVRPSAFSAAFCRLRKRLQGRARRGQTAKTTTARAAETAWRRTLPNAPSDPELSWTEAGGDSLAMLQLLLRLEHALGRKLGFDLLSDEMTLTGLIGRLQAGDSVSGSGASVPVMHLVPGLLGDEPDLASFRRAFNGAIRFELIEPPELDADGAVLRSLEQTGRRVAREIEERQPTGRIILAGYSFGGAVAFEAAKQIMEDGRRVGLLIVLDTRISPEPGDGLSGRSENEASHYFWAKLPLLKLAERDAARHALLPLVGLLGNRIMTDFRRLVLRQFRFEAGKSWRPTALVVPTVIVLSEEVGTVNRSQWAALAPGCTFVDLPGGHHDLFAARALALYKPILLDAISGADSNAETA